MSSSGATERPAKVVNCNVGILGHVDSGKTSLSKLISSHGSTAAFDKNPQSQARGITLDLGFSVVYDKKNVPKHLADAGYEAIQYTLVDCPGHASLIRTVIGGAQIMDVMILVIDATKGIQTQTAECIVLGDITTEHLVVVLNKVDQLIPPEQPQLKTVEEIEKKTSKMKASLLKNVFSKTKFKNLKIVEMSTTDPDLAAHYVPKLIETLQEEVSFKLNNFLKAIPSQSSSSQQNKPFLFMADHCFEIKGKGTVLTGTTLRGEFVVGRDLYIPSLAETRKIKSIQSFGKSVELAKRGDRVGVLVTQLDPTRFERGFVCSPPAFLGADELEFFKNLVFTPKFEKNLMAKNPNSSNWQEIDEKIENNPFDKDSLVRTCHSLIVSAVPIEYYTHSSIKSKQKFHISIGHSTHVAHVKFFCCKKEEWHENISGTYFSNNGSQEPSFKYVDYLKKIENEEMDEEEKEQKKKEKREKKEKKEREMKEKEEKETTTTTKDNSKEKDKKEKQEKQPKPKPVQPIEPYDDKKYQYFAILNFQTPIVCHFGGEFIASRLDMDAMSKTCRMAFHGKILQMAPFQQSVLLEQQQQQEQFLDPHKLYFPNLCIFREKSKTAVVEKLLNEKKLVGSKLLEKKEADYAPLVGKTIKMSIRRENVEKDEILEGKIDAVYGKPGSGKFSVSFEKENDPEYKIPADVIDKFEAVAKKKKEKLKDNKENKGKKDDPKKKSKISALPEKKDFVKISTLLILDYKINIFDHEKKWIQ